MKSSITAYMQHYDYENLYFCQHQESGLKAIISIHDTTLGPAVGGCRMWPYENDEEAIEDVLRLSRGMTYKYAAAGLNLGGGKTVIIGDPKKHKSEALFRALGRFLNRLNGAYYTGLDSGVNLTDMEYIRLETEYVVTIPAYLGGAGPISPYTARSTVLGMKAALKHLGDSDLLQGKKIAVQGVGGVGYHVVDYLINEGVAEIIVTDIFEDRINKIKNDFAHKIKLEVVSSENIYDVSCDVFSPCALGAIINTNTLEKLKCEVICGSANNQLQDDETGDKLASKGILYIPDFIVNAGGTIYDTDRIIYGQHNHERAKAKVEGVYGTILKVLALAENKKIQTYRAAELLAEERIEKYKSIKIMDR